VFSLPFVVSLVALYVIVGNAFQPIRLESTFGGRVGARRIGRNEFFFFVRTNHDSVRYASPSEKESDSVQKLFDYDGNNFDDEIDEIDLEEIEAGQPPEWMVMQQVNNDEANIKLSASFGQKRNELI
jgi:hypothetical protein